MNAKKLLTTLAISSTLALSHSALAANASNKNFTPEQKSQIEQITREYLINNPDILVEVSQKLQEQQEQQLKKIEENAQKVIPTIAKELFNDPNSPAIGNPKGSVTVVEFFDYQCPHCKDMSEVLNELVKQDKNLRVVYKEFPIFGSSSVFASKAALAAAKQNKYEQFHEALMNASNPLNKEKVLAAAKSVGLNVDQLQKDMDSKAIKEELESNLKLAQKLGIMGTPAFVIGSTKDAKNPDSPAFFVPGSTSEEIMQGLVEQVRQGKQGA